MKIYVGISMPLRRTDTGASGPQAREISGDGSSLSKRFVCSYREGPIM